LSTVHWVITRSSANERADAVRQTYAWGNRKRQFSEKQIYGAFDRLESQHWIAGT
jgi:hypothetical protein